tara:strand:+ start:272 stop:1099 length:828 start_codon:yes stop_codon:yes gene_type:complete
VTAPNDVIVSHYENVDLYQRITDALQSAGKNLDAITVEDLVEVDEFHIGGIQATNDLLDQLDIGPETRVLDIGSGLGGPARHISSRYGAKLTGIDLTPEFVETATRLTDLCKLDINFHVGSALDIPLEDGGFDLATLIHVGMNLPDKATLFTETARVLRPEGVFAVYDVMSIAKNHPNFPVPWASTKAGSFLEPPEKYRSAAEAAGFVLLAERARVEFALDFFKKLKADTEKNGPSQVGLHLVMGPDTPTKIKNMIDAIKDGWIAPVEMLFKKAP